MWLLIAWRREHYINHKTGMLLWVIETCDCAYQITFSFNHGCLCSVCDSLLRLSIVLITVPRNMDIKIAILVVLCLHCTGTLNFIHFKVVFYLHPESCYDSETFDSLVYLARCYKGLPYTYKNVFILMKLMLYCCITMITC